VTRPVPNRDASPRVIPCAPPDGLTFPLDHVYIEIVYLPALGLAATALARQLGRHVAAHDGPVTINLATLARKGRPTSRGRQPRREDACHRPQQPPPDRRTHRRCASRLRKNGLPLGGAESATRSAPVCEPRSIQTERTSRRIEPFETAWLNDLRISAPC
jgi:hypothetical protein